MKMLAFAVLDEKTEAFLPPFFVVAPGQAIRLFTDGCADRESPLGKHPGDYKLYRIGSFDDAAGGLSGEQPVLMCSGAEVTTQQLRAV
ncbi:MAG: nonstructural protein [Microvirus sp.]|nr:MAG: nonstructural protein [Microvirus sp.]